MTGMPELIALLHSFVGLAAVLVGWNGALDSKDIPESFLGIHHAEVFIGVFIGGVTFTGSIVAYLKLSARISSRPLMLPGKNALNIGALVLFVGLTAWYVVTPELWLLIAVTALALLLGRAHPALAERAAQPQPAEPQQARLAIALGLHRRLSHDAVLPPPAVPRQ
jgi:NAD(P) transhydrogenase subunit beta